MIVDSKNWSEQNLEVMGQIDANKTSVSMTNGTNLGKKSTKRISTVWKKEVDSLLYNS